MEELIKAWKDAQVKADDAYMVLKAYKDGFIYVTCERVYGSLTYSTHTNAFVTQNLCNEYNGDDGIVDIYTNNPNHNIENYSGSTYVVTLEELDTMAKGNISMSRAMTNWRVQGSL